MFYSCLFKFDRYGAPYFLRPSGSFESETTVFAFNKEKALPAFRSARRDASPKPLHDSKESWSYFVDRIGNKWWYLSGLIRKNGDEFRGSELFRSVGSLNCEWSDDSSFTIQVECYPFSRNGLERLLADFKGSFFQLILSDDSPVRSGVESGEVKSEQGRWFSSDDLECLVRTAEGLLAKLKNRLTVREAVMSSRQIKPFGVNVLRMLKKPNAPTLCARETVQDLNTPENRFIAHVLARTLKLVEAELSSRQTQSFTFFDNKDPHFLEGMRQRLEMCLYHCKQNGIATRMGHFNQVIFQQNPDYSRFYRHQKAFFAKRADIENLIYSFDKFRNIQITNFSEVYERWCLISLIQLIKNLGFVPVGDWKEQIISDILSGGYNNEILFEHEEYRFQIQLGYEHELSQTDSGQFFRPDFVLQFIDPKCKGDAYPKLVLDAKFRTVFEARECRRLLNELAYSKDYIERNRRFKGLGAEDLERKGSLSDGRNLLYLIYPTPEDERPTYYGLMNRGKGWIHAFPEEGYELETSHLREVLLLWLQDIEHTAGFTASDQKLCPSCGASGSSLAEETIYRGDDFHFSKLTCRTCGEVRIKTFCPKCGHEPLFVSTKQKLCRKDGGLQCPDCGTLLRWEDWNS